MKEVFKLLLIISLLTLASCESKRGESTAARPVSISIVHDNDLGISEWLKSAAESFKAEAAPSFKGSNIEIVLSQEATATSIDELASGKEKADAILLPNSGFSEVIRGKIKNLGAAVSSCKDLIGSPYVAIIPKRQAANLTALLGRTVLDSDQSVVSVKLKELGQLLSKSQYGYTHPARSARGQFGLLLSIASLSKDVSPGNMQWVLPKEDSILLQKHLEWYAPSDALLVKRIASQNSSLSKNIFSELNIGLISERQLQSHQLLKNDFTVLMPSDSTIWETHSLCISEADWVNPLKKSILMKFQEYLASETNLEKAKERGFISVFEKEPVKPDEAETQTPDNKSMPKPIKFSASKTELLGNFVAEHMKPYSISFAMDTSASMSPETIAQLREFATKLINAGPSTAKVDLIRFSSDVEIIGNRETNRNTLDNRLTALTASGGSSIYDTIAKQYELQSKNQVSDTRRVALIVTDGSDKNSQKSVEELIDIVTDLERSKGFVSLHLVLVSPAGVDQEPLKKIVDAANGSLYEVEPERLLELLGEIEQSL